MITYHHGDATQPADIEGCYTIAHVLSDTGAYAAGFAAAIARRYPRARTRFEGWARRDPTCSYRPFELGAIQWVAVGHDLDGSHAMFDRWVLNMVAQHGLHHPQRNPHPLDLGALERCLKELAEAPSGPIVMPRIGCGLARGRWDEVEPIIKSALAEADVHVYDLPDGG